MRLTGLALFGLLSAVALADCSVSGETVGSNFDRPLASAPGVVDARAAAKLISEYRARHGLPTVTVDRRLTAIAADHARRMASANRVAHVLPGEGSFQRRLATGGFDAAVAAENIGGGYKTLAEALEGWRRSPPHNANLLRGGVSRIGIAVFSAPGSTYKTYWSLILAEP
ncbi:MAG: CAP domain-containing protein [Bauldia sp.]